MKRGLEKNKIKEFLLSKLKEENAFWSYDPSSVTLENYSDSQLIADTFRYLDLAEIKLLFEIYPYKKIKDSWLKLLVPEGEYLYTLNRFFAWYYFNIKDPDRYLKSMYTRHLNSLFSD